MKKVLLQIVWKQFTQRKLRSSLTILGIVIGISALVSLILLSAALKNGVQSQFDSFGTDKVFVAPKASLNGGNGPVGVGKFTTKDIRVVEGVPGVLKVSPFVSLPASVEVGREKTRLVIQGILIDEDYESTISQKISSGRFLTSSDRKSVNIGSRIAKKEFDKEIFVGNSLTIQGEKYTVVGIFESAGSLEKDTAIFANIDAVRDTIGKKDAVSAISAKISPGTDMELAEERIGKALEDSRGEKDFETTTPVKIKEQIGSILGAVDIVVVSIALVSLFVASLGIMNSLYTSVMQRTKEIGTMKAVGATNAQVLFLFITESALLGFVGGVLGILAGLLFAFGLAIPLNAFGIFQFTVSIDWLFLGEALLFSTLLGVLSGMFPAFRAARLHPVDALRHE